MIKKLDLKHGSKNLRTKEFRRTKELKKLKIKINQIKNLNGEKEVVNIKKIR